MSFLRSAQAKGDTQILAPDCRQTFLDYPCLFLLNTSLPLQYFVRVTVLRTRVDKGLEEQNMQNNQRQGYFRGGGICGMQFRESHDQVLQLATCTVHSCQCSEKGSPGLPFMRDLV
jgi:hypothetical protein